MYVIFILFFLLFISLILISKNYQNPYKLIMVFGKKGSGKTTFLTKTAIKAIKKGTSVYSTVVIPGTKYFDVKDLGSFVPKPNSLVLIDEVGMVWDNRNFKGFKPEVRDFFKLQRHYKCTVYLFSQSFDIDKKLRDLTDQMYLLTNFMNIFSIQRRILKKITIGTDLEGNGHLVDTYKFASIFGGLHFTFIPRYTSFFDSYDVPPLDFIKSYEIAFNEVQQRYLKTSRYIWDKLYSFFLNLRSFSLKFFAKKRSKGKR